MSIICGIIAMTESQIRIPLRVYCYNVAGARACSHAHVH